MDSMSGLSIKIPSKKVQVQLVKDVEKRERKIKASEKILAGISSRKEAVIKSYLMDETTEIKLNAAAEPKANYKRK